jgi:hypothetical protein
MNATTDQATVHAPLFASTPFVVTVGSEECVVRAAMICSIPEVLGFEEEMDVAGGMHADLLAAAAFDSGLIADLLDSRMIAPPRTRRRERAVSSRAMFYAPASR